MSVESVIINGQRYVLETPKAIEKHIEVGDVYLFYAPHSKTKVVILNEKWRPSFHIESNHLYCLGGYCGNPLALYSNPPQTLSELKDYLHRNNSAYLGSLKDWPTIFPGCFKQEKNDPQ